MKPQKILTSLAKTFHAKTTPTREEASYTGELELYLYTSCESCARHDNTCTLPDKLNRQLRFKMFSQSTHSVLSVGYNHTRNNTQTLIFSQTHTSLDNLIALIQAHTVLTKKYYL